MKVLRANGTNEDVALTPQSLATLQKLVGGYIEFFEFDDGTALIVNEEGKMHGLPCNEQATALTLLKRRPEVIAGDCVFLSYAENRIMQAE